MLNVISGKIKENKHKDVTLTCNCTDQNVSQVDWYPYLFPCQMSIHVQLVVVYLGLTTWWLSSKKYTFVFLSSAG